MIVHRYSIGRQVCDVLERKNLSLLDGERIRSRSSSASVFSSNNSSRTSSTVCWIEYSLVVDFDRLLALVFTIDIISAKR